MTPPAASVEVPAAPAPRQRDAERRLRRSLSSRRARVIRVGAVLLIMAFVVFCVSVSLGEFPIALRDVVSSILGGGRSGTRYIVFELRAPRVITAMMVGGALALAGAIFQSLFRNPLASPDILGVTAGAATGAVLVITTGIGSGRYAVLAAFAFVGGLVMTVLIYVLAYRHGVSPYRFVLIGIGLGAMAVAVTAYLVTRATVFGAAEFASWSVGTLNARGWETVGPMTIGLIVLTAAAALLARHLECLELGEDLAEGLGAGVERSRRALLGVGVALAGIATAAAGPVAFVALMAPPIARRLTKGSPALIISALVGAVLVATADLVGRRVLAPTELNVGIITGIIGAPYLLWLLIRGNRAGQGG